MIRLNFTPETGIKERENGQLAVHRRSWHCLQHRRLEIEIALLIPDV
ncbi:hypothetical protein ACFLYQ_05755 [Chloroflexota bacterium]